MDLEGLAKLITDSKLELGSKIDSIAAGLQKKVQDLESAVGGVKKEVAALKKENLDLMTELRARNIIIHGVLESAGESPATLLKDISNILKEVNIISVQFDFVHRIGKPGSSTQRPIKLGLLKLTDKYKIIAAGKLLFTKPALSGIFFIDDLPKEIRQNRGLLRKEKSAAIVNGHSATIRGNVLTVNNKDYTVQDGAVVAMDTL